MGKIVRKTPEELKTMRDRGEDLTDWERVRAITQDEADRLAREDLDNPFKTDADYDRATVRRGVRGPQKAPTKEPVAIRLSPEVVSYFKATGKGWQGRIDAVLREWVKTHKAA